MKQKKIWQKKSIYFFKCVWRNLHKKNIKESFIKLHFPPKDYLSSKLKMLSNNLTGPEKQLYSLPVTMGFLFFFFFTFTSSKMLCRNGTRSQQLSWLWVIYTTCMLLCHSFCYWYTKLCCCRTFMAFSWFWRKLRGAF